MFSFVGKVGITLDSDFAFSDTDEPEDVEAADRHMEFGVNFNI